MPSRKKAQGKARKAKREAAASRCFHLGERNWMPDDAIAVNELYIELAFQNQSAVPGPEDYARDLILLTNCIYDKYYQLSDERKGLFQRRLLAAGTSACLAAANQIDLTKECFDDADRLLLLIQTIEVRDKYNGAYNGTIHLEIQAPFNDIVRCPREIVRFFHRRNLCDCLQAIYYKLKETTKRTAGCWGCLKMVDIINMSRCIRCEMAQYCSYECATANWPNHKEECKEWRKLREPKEKSDSSDNIEKVD